MVQRVSNTILCENLCDNIKDNIEFNDEDTTVARISIKIHATVALI